MKGSLRKIFEMISEMFVRTEKEDSSIRDLLESVKNEIRMIRSSIDNVKDEKLLEMYIYRLKIAQEQYRHLLKMAKDNDRKIS